MSNYRGRFLPGNQNNNWNMAFDLVRPGTKVLDVGCGNGNFGEALMRLKGCSVDGVEPNKLDARRAAKRIVRIYNSKIEEAFNYIPQSVKYDHIVFLDVIEHLYSPADTLKKLKDYLKSDGTIIFSIPNMGHQSVRVMLLKGEFEYGRTGILDNTHLHFYTDKEINRVFNEAGYSLRDLKGVSIMYDQETLKEQLKLSGVEDASEGLLGVLSSNNAHIYQYVGAAVPSDDIKPKRLNRKFQSPEAKAVLEKSYEVRVKRSEEKLKQKIKELKYELEAIYNSRSWKVARVLQKASNSVGGNKLMGKNIKK